MAFSIDLRSDTVTQPCAEMRSAMASAEVGDDVIGSDPTVEALQEEIAEMLGKEAAIFVPSGTMANQVAVRVHCRPGDALICESECHIYCYEQGGLAQLAGVLPHLVQGKHGVIRPEQLHGMIMPDDDHAVRTRLLTFENTHNRGGGKVQPQDSIQTACAWAREHGLVTHLDGARLFNAAVASNVSVGQLAAPFDSVSVCFSKGLGAPIGSALAGSQEFIRDARRIKKLFGGGMRQVGVIAAGAWYALQNNIHRLQEDHEHAKLLARNVASLELIDCTSQPETNIVLLDIDPLWGTPAQFVARLEDQGVGAFPFGPQAVRLVTHRDVDREQIENANQIIREIAQEPVAAG